MFTCRVFKDSTSVFDVCMIFGIRLISGGWWTETSVISFETLLLLFQQSVQTERDVICLCNRPNAAWQKRHLGVTAARHHWFYCICFNIYPKKKWNNSSTSLWRSEIKTHMTKILVVPSNPHRKYQKWFLQRTEEKDFISRSTFFFFPLRLKSSEIDQHCTYKWISLSHIQIWFVYHYGSPCKRNKCCPMESEKDWNVVWKNTKNYEILTNCCFSALMLTK